MSVIIYDTDCELWYTQEDELGCPVIKMPYTIDDEEYFYDFGRNTNFKDFYDRVRQGSMPSTSALNPQQYIEFLEPFFAKGEDILYISFSDKLSGTFGHLETALNQLQPKYPDARFRRFSTLNISFGAGYQVYYAIKYFQSGKSLDEVIEFLESFTKNVSVYFMVDSLKYLYKGGRLSAAESFFGTMLGYKPVLKVNDEGALVIHDKPKGEKKAIALFMERLASIGSDLNKYPIVVIDADNPDFADRLIGKIKEQYPDAEIWHYPVGPVIGSHCGPGTVGLIFHSTER